MKPGPRKKPAELKLLQGNPGEHRLPKREVEIPAKCNPPAILAGYALKEWRRVAPMLQHLGLLKGIDREALAAYCLAVQLVRTARKRLDQDGEFIRAGNGTLIPHPALQLLQKAMDRAVKYSAEFGLSPAARAGLDITGKSDRDPYDDDFFGL